MKHVLIAGGLCGATMLIVAEKIRERCAAQGVSVETMIQNLWETSYVRPGYDLIVEMFPFFEDMDCPVADGRPFINHVGEEALLGKIAALLCSEVKQ
ncbi:hypothetical protein D3Z52_22410 [Clostridiaceae bacterium]|nr:hypothetical protein [Clostridiaceae bacterium]RKJ81943.1 hypothetical protein D7X33_03155 [Butyricicoccus sp. 1XD8-22]